MPKKKITFRDFPYYSDLLLWQGPKIVVADLLSNMKDFVKIYIFSKNIVIISLYISYIKIRLFDNGKFWDTLGTHGDNLGMYWKHIIGEVFRMDWDNLGTHWG